MNIFKNLFLFKKKSVLDNKVNHELVDQYGEIAKLVKEARIQKNITIQELSRISKIPERTIISIETNNKNIRLPNSKTLWKLENQTKLAPNNPIKLLWTNDKDIIFEKKISIDDQYLFTVEQTITNKSDNIKISKILNRLKFSLLFKNIFSLETSETNLKLSLTRMSEYISICFEMAIENDLLIIKIKSIIS